MLGRKHVDGVAAHPEITPGKIQVVALVLHAHQLGNHIALAHAVTASQRHDHLVVALRVANAVNGRHCGHNDHIAPLHEAFGARKAHLLNVLVDGAVFFNKQVALRHIGLRLVVVVITYKVLHRIFRKKFPKLAVKLSGQCFVGCKHNGGAAQAGNHVGHGEGLARTCYTQKSLKHLAVQYPIHQQIDRLGLIACGRIGLVKLKRRAFKGHEFPLSHFGRSRGGGKINSSWIHAL